MTSEDHTAAPSLNPFGFPFHPVLSLLHTSWCQFCSHHINQDTSGWILWSWTSPPGQVGAFWVSLPPGENRHGPIFTVCWQNWPPLLRCWESWGLACHEHQSGCKSLHFWARTRGVDWWSTETLNLQTLACGCFWNLSSSTSTGQTATVHFQRPEGGSVRTTFCLTVGTPVRPEILATHPQLLLRKHCPDRQLCVT